MSNLQLNVTIWINLSNKMLNGESQTQNSTLTIPCTPSSKTNKINFWFWKSEWQLSLGGADTTRNWHKTGFCDIGNILFLLLCQYDQFAIINQAVYL